MDIEELKRKVKDSADIVEIASRYTTLKKSGKHYKGLCPFHQEKTPSFYVDPEKKLYHCFGCGAGGDVIKLVMELEGVSFIEALKSLARHYGIPFSLSKKSSKNEDLLYAIMEEANKLYHRELWKKGRGYAYMKKRKISEDVAKELSLGYAPDSWDFILKSLSGKFSQNDLERAGLIIRKEDGGYYDRFRDRLIFPIYAEYGRVVGFGGRAINPDIEAKYINSPETLIYKKGKTLYGLNWTKNEIRKTGKAIIVEGYMDFLTLYSAGIKNVVASLGTSLTEEQAVLLSRFASEVYISYDNDEAGKKSTVRSIPILFSKGLSVNVINLENAKDPDEYVEKFGPVSYIYKMEESEKGVIFLFNFFGRENREIGVKRAIEAISMIPDPIKKRYQVGELSYVSRMEENILLAMLEGDVPIETQKRKLLTPLEEEAVKIISCCSREFLDALDSETSSILRDSKYSYLLLLAEAKAEEKEDIMEVVKENLKAEVSRIFFEGEKPSISAEKLVKNLRDNVLKERIKKIQLEIKAAEREGNSEKIIELMRKKQNLIKKIRGKNG